MTDVARVLAARVLVRGCLAKPLPAVVVPPAADVLVEDGHVYVSPSLHAAIAVPHVLIRWAPDTCPYLAATVVDGDLQGAHIRVPARLTSRPAAVTLLPMNCKHFMVTLNCISTVTLYPKGAFDAACAAQGWRPDSDDAAAALTRAFQDRVDACKTVNEGDTLLFAGVQLTFGRLYTKNQERAACGFAWEPVAAPYTMGVDVVPLPPDAVPLPEDVTARLRALTAKWYHDDPRRRSVDVLTVFADTVTEARLARFLADAEQGAPKPVDVSLLARLHACLA